jgi:CBS domain-containing protein
MEKLLHNYLIRQVNLAPGLTVKEDRPLREVVEAMKEKKAGSVVVMSAGNGTDKVMGIFTERDLLNRVINEPVNWNDPIRKFCTTSPTMMKADEPLRKAVYMMRKKNILHVPIFENDGALLGVLSVRNVIRLLAEHFPTEVMNLPPRLNQTMPTPEGG